MKRLDLAEVVLTLKAAGVENLRAFRWLEAPEEQALAHAEELLEDLGAIEGPKSKVQSPKSEDNVQPVDAHATRNAQCSRITPLGRKMLAFPLHPRYARMLLAAEQYGCVYHACLVAALTQGRDLLLRNVDRNTASNREDLLGEKASSDFWILMRAYTFASKNDFGLGACRRLGIHAVTARQVGPLFQQFLEIARKEKLNAAPREVPDEALQKCLLTAFSDRLAKRMDSGTLRCDIVHGRRGVLARESAVQHSALLVAAEIREVEGKDKTVNTLLSLATAVEQKWLEELFPGDLEGTPRVFYDSVTRRVYAEEQLRFRDLVIGTRRVEPPPLATAGRLLAEEVVAGRLTLNDWDHAAEQWVLRLNLLSRWCPELALPPLEKKSESILSSKSAMALSATKRSRTSRFNRCCARG